MFTRVASHVGHGEVSQVVVVRCVHRVVIVVVVGDETVRLVPVQDQSGDDVSPDLAAAEKPEENAHELVDDVVSVVDLFPVLRVG